MVKKLTVWPLKVKLESLHKLKFYPSVLLLMIKMSQSAREKFDSYCKTVFSNLENVTTFGYNPREISCFKYWWSVCLSFFWTGGRQRSGRERYIERSYLALINRAGGLYGRILTEVVSTVRTQWDLYTRPRSRFSHIDRLSSVNKMFIIWQRRKL